MCIDISVPIVYQPGTAGYSLLSPRGSPLKVRGDPEKTDLDHNGMVGLVPEASHTSVWVKILPVIRFIQAGPSEVGDKS